MLFLFSFVLADFGVHSGDTVLPKQVGQQPLSSKSVVLHGGMLFGCRGAGGIVKAESPRPRHGLQTNELVPILKRIEQDAA